MLLAEKSFEKDDTEAEVAVLSRRKIIMTGCIKEKKAFLEEVQAAANAKGYQKQGFANAEQKLAEHTALVARTTRERTGADFALVVSPFPPLPKTLNAAPVEAWVALAR